MLTRDYNIYECNRCKSFRVTAPAPVEMYCKAFRCRLVGEGNLASPPDSCPRWDKGKPEYIKRTFERAE